MEFLVFNRNMDPAPILLKSPSALSNPGHHGLNLPPPMSAHFVSFFTKHLGIAGIDPSATKNDKLATKPLNHTLRDHINRHLVVGYRTPYCINARSRQHNVKRRLYHVFPN